MIKTFENGLLGSNTHLYYDEKSGEGMIIDCGNNPAEVNLFCMQKGIKVKYIVLTHGHYDHAHYVSEYKSTFRAAKILSHNDEIAVLSNPSANVSEFFGKGEAYPMPDETVDDGDTLKIGESVFKVLHTPGHTPGGICLCCEKERIVFTGDTLFFGGIGRTDFLYGDDKAMLFSLRRLFKMDGDTDFYSGHGMSGKIKHERY